MITIDQHTDKRWYVTQHDKLLARDRQSLKTWSSKTAARHACARRNDDTFWSNWQSWE